MEGVACSNSAWYLVDFSALIYLFPTSLLLSFAYQQAMSAPSAQDMDDLLSYFDLDAAVADAGGAADVQEDDSPPPGPPSIPASSSPQFQNHRAPSPPSFPQSQLQSQLQPGHLDLSTLKDKFGHGGFKPLQWSAIAAVAQGRDCCCVRPELYIYIYLEA